jgi:hypothetical protein
MARKLGSLWLILWGVVNLVGGLTAGRHHPSGWVLPAFALLGILISIGGVGFWLRKTWSVPVSLLGLLGLSIAALLSGSVLRRGAGPNLLHHAVRLAISGTGFVTAFLGLRRDRRMREPRAPGGSRPAGA